jgi:hypothetical protein
MILYAAGVAVVFATLLRDTVAEQWRLGARIFSGLVVGALVVGWLMFVVAA